MNTSTGASVAQQSELNCSQVRGVWHRPNSSQRETNLEELCVVLDEFKEAGINLVFLETFYHGMAIYKTDIVSYHTKLVGFEYGEYPDYLSAFVAEANKRGIAVHAWVQDFYVGFREEVKLVVDHPEWMLINQSGGIRHTTEGHGFGGYLFLDPANKEVRDFIASVYNDILTRFPTIQGLNLDYIRYPISVYEEGTDTGYTDISMRGFAERCNLEIDYANARESFHSLIAEKNLLNEWIAYRAEFITMFIEQVRNMIDTCHKGKIISTAIFPEIDQTYYMKKQSIKVWLDSGYIDMVTPMVHFYSASQIYEAVKKLKSMCHDTRCYTGLYTTYHNQTITELADHIKASENAGADGVVLFDAAKTFFEATQDYKGYLSQTYGQRKNN